MKTTPIILVIILFVFSSCSLAMRYVGGMKPAKVENEESIIEGMEKLGMNSDFTYSLKGNADSASIYYALSLGYGLNRTFYNTEGQALQYTGQETCGGSIEAAGFEGNMKEFEPNPKDSINLHDLIPELQRLNYGDTSKNFPLSEYYYVIHWCKYFYRKDHLKEEIELLKDFQSKTKSEITIVFINCDLQESWGLNPKGKMKMKIKVKGGRNGGSMDARFKSKRLYIE